MVEGPDSSKPDDIPTTKNEAPKKKSKEEKQPSKVIIRKLPGSMTEESFLEFISPLFEHDYFYYVQNENPGFGDQSYSRAYINFVNVEDVFTFTMKFDDYIFIDETGQEYPAVVEYAPFQRIPKNRGNRKTDPLSGTIEEDLDYQEFMRQLEFEEQQEHKAITEHYFDLANDENQEKVTTTPLIEYLMSRKNEYMKYKEEKKEERRRRDIERRKLKEESRRIKKESKETPKTKIIEKSKEEKKITQDSKIFEEITSSSRVRGKSYQEERQRDLARRKGEEKSTKTDDNKENNKNVTPDKSPEFEDDKTPKDSESAKPLVRSDHKDEDGYKKNYDDKKSYCEDDRKLGYHSRERDDKKYSYGMKKREFVGGYDHDGKYKGTGSKGGGYYYDDYKSRGHSSYQKNAYVGGKYGKSKDYYEEKTSKRYDGKTKKYEHADCKDSKKAQKEFDKKYADSKPADGKSDAKSTEKFVKKEDRKDTEMSTKSGADCLSRSSSKDNEGHSGNTSEIESSKSQDSKKEKKDDPRVERRIKNKDRPALEIYRPGMGKFSRQRLERNKSTEGKECD